MSPKAGYPISILAILATLSTLRNVLSFSSQYVELCGVRHHVRDTGEVVPGGEGPVAVLLHGFAGNTEAWVDVAPLLAAGGCRVIAVDRVGFGRTERPRPPSFPVPPALPFAEAIAERIESSVGDGDRSTSPRGSMPQLPDPRLVAAAALRDPGTLAPRFPWRATSVAGGDNPYGTAFAALRALPALLRERLGSGKERSVYLVGHSAGCSVVLRALTEPESLVPRGAVLGGIALLAPAVLDPRENPEVFSETPGFLDGTPLPGSVQRRLELETTFAFFRAVMAAPDAVGLQTARRIYEGRDLQEAVLSQMSPRMRSPEFSRRILELQEKYTAPVKEFPEEWDRALLDVYRADMVSEKQRLSGQALLAASREACRKLSIPILVATGDVDSVVKPQASQKVSDLLGADRFEIIKDTGHLPMDERPQETCDLLLDFFGLNVTCTYVAS